ncbi:hypothetical protein FEM48_Zijuj02G0012700 [Ziziphus jujuba var. spinosa]|uniref:Glycoside hydrolase family 3 C-terminal domain-containing protein n=1 Tax=Ziziphus jujuba var. spinosa TaxID=714518 RepID=A0A978VSR9_ZIZJJ|nr:hypothetical protein FEM48_Zijuj02G0012700 [Ziziphus jujuba var. spinosa]
MGLFENPWADQIQTFVDKLGSQHHYAETFGDSPNLTIAEPGPHVINNVCGRVKCVVLLVSGRPFFIEPHVPSIDALAAAWLLGTEGHGIADVLFGDYGFTGKLPRTVDPLPMNVGDPHYDPVHPFGYDITANPIESN